MTNVLAIIAIVVSLGALAASAVTARYNRRSADASEASATSADRSADAAKDAADQARRVADAEVNRDHEMYRPQQTIANLDKVHDEIKEENHLFLTFTPPRTFRVAGDAIHASGNGKESRSPLAVGPVIEAGRPVRVYIGQLTSGMGTPLPKAVELRFWPPVQADPGEEWTCPCNRPADESGPAHWLWRKTIPDNLDYNIMESIG